MKEPLWQRLTSYGCYGCSLLLLRLLLPPKPPLSLSTSLLVQHNEPELADGQKPKAQWESTNHQIPNQIYLRGLVQSKEEDWIEYLLLFSNFCTTSAKTRHPLQQLSLTFAFTEISECNRYIPPPLFITEHKTATLLHSAYLIYHGAQNCTTNVF